MTPVTPSGRRQHGSHKTKAIPGPGGGYGRRVPLRGATPVRKSALPRSRADRFESFGSVKPALKPDSTANAARRARGGGGEGESTRTARHRVWARSKGGDREEHSILDSIDKSVTDGERDAGNQQSRTRRGRGALRRRWEGSSLGTALGEPGRGVQDVSRRRASMRQARYAHATAAVAA